MRATTTAFPGVLGLFLWPRGLPQAPYGWVDYCPSLEVLALGHPHPMGTPANFKLKMVGKRFAAMVMVCPSPSRSQKHPQTHRAFPILSTFFIFHHFSTCSSFTIIFHHFSSFFIIFHHLPVFTLWFFCNMSPPSWILQALPWRTSASAGNASSTSWPWWIRRPSTAAPCAISSCALQKNACDAPGKNGAFHYVYVCTTMQVTCVLCVDVLLYIYI